MALREAALPCLHALAIDAAAALCLCLADALAGRRSRRRDLFGLTNALCGDDPLLRVDARHREHDGTIENGVDSHAQPSACVPMRRASSLRSTWRPCGRACQQSAENTKR